MKGSEDTIKTRRSSSQPELSLKSCRRFFLNKFRDIKFTIFSVGGRQMGLRLFELLLLTVPESALPLLLCVASTITAFPESVKAIKKKVFADKKANKNRQTKPVKILISNLLRVHIITHIQIPFLMSRKGFPVPWGGEAEVFLVSFETLQMKTSENVDCREFRGNYKAQLRLHEADALGED